VTTTLFVILVPLALILLIAALCRGSAAGWLLIGTGLAFLIHAGVTIYLIYVHDGLVPDYRWMNYWMLYATIPAGAFLLLAGGLAFCIRTCAARRARAKLEPNT
jgi:hypothetical protein